MVRKLANPKSLRRAGVEDAKLGLTPKIHWLKKTFDQEDHHHYLEGYTSKKKLMSKIK